MLQFNILNSSRDPGLWTNECQILRSFEATASRTMVGFFSLPWNCPAHPAGQFFHCQCMPSTLPLHPGKPQASYSLIMVASCSLFGWPRNLSLNNTAISVMKCLRVTSAVVSPIRTYSSIESAAHPVANCRRHAVTFCSVDSPRTPHASFKQPIKVSILRQTKPPQTYWFLNPEGIVRLEFVT